MDCNEAVYSEAYADYLIEYNGRKEAVLVNHIG